MTEKLDLRIDCEEVINKIVSFLRNKINEQKKDGIIFGLSGGIDSAVVAHLAVLAINDPVKVTALYLPDRDSDARFNNYALNVARKLGISFHVNPITDEVEKENVYKPCIIRLTSFFPILNKTIIWSSDKIIYPIFFQKPSFIVALEKGDSAKGPIAKFLYKNVASAIEEGFNARHRARRRILEKRARELNLLLIGCANRSEAFVGWFVKDGVDDLPIETIMDLYKTQVRQLAIHLGVPEKIIKVKPSPDMLKKVGDEDVIGHKYETIDKVAFVAENNLDAKLAFDAGVAPKEFDQIIKIHRLSEWKRANPHEYPKLG